MFGVARFIRFRDGWLRLGRRIRRGPVIRGNVTLSPPRRIEKIIWIFWAQGRAEAPPIVRDCVASWEDRNPGWEVRFLDREGLTSIIDTKDIPRDIPLAHQADAIRLRLLERHGGVWADATCYCAKPLDDWLLPLMQSGFFAFAYPGPDRLLDNWLLASEKDGLIAREWGARVVEYLPRWKKGTPYFWPLYVFEWQVRTNRAIRRAWAETPKVSADGPLFIQRCFQRGIPPGEVAPDIDLAAVPVHKLSWKPGKVNTLEEMRAWGLPLPLPEAPVEPARGTGT